MNKEIIIKLLQSSMLDDIILGLNYMKDWNLEDLLSFTRPGVPDNRAMDTKFKARVEGRYIINDNLYCHVNVEMIFFYEMSAIYEPDRYIKL